MPAYTRRRLLAGGAVGLAALAGCTSTADQRERPAETPSTAPFVVRNRAETARLVTVTLRRGNETLLDRSYELAAGDRQELDNPIDGQGSYELAVELASGTSDRVAWTLADCERVEHVVIILSRADTVEIETERETVSPSACE